MGAIIGVIHIIIIIGGLLWFVFFIRRYYYRPYNLDAEILISEYEKYTKRVEELTKLLNKKTMELGVYANRDIDDILVSKYYEISSELKNLYNTQQANIFYRNVINIAKYIELDNDLNPSSLPNKLCKFIICLWRGYDIPSTDEYLYLNYHKLNSNYVEYSYYNVIVDG